VTGGSLSGRGHQVVRRSLAATWAMREWLSLGQGDALIAVGAGVFSSQDARVIRPRHRGNCSLNWAWPNATPNVTGAGRRAVGQFETHPLPTKSLVTTVAPGLVRGYKQRRASMSAVVIPVTFNDRSTAESELPGLRASSSIAASIAARAGKCSRAARYAPCGPDAVSNRSAISDSSAPSGGLRAHHPPHEPTDRRGGQLHAPGRD
jgi:hypothetical protein